MSDLFTSKNNALKVFGKTLLCALCVFVAGAINAPRVSAASLPQVPQVRAVGVDQPVPVDQQPLTVAAPLPPNIVLMLDDSGSMMYDVMPDWKYLKPYTQVRLTDASVNGVYYNPSVTYTPPPKVDGTSYPASDFTAAPVDGFDSSTTRPIADLSHYDGGYDSSNSLTISENYPKGPSKIYYSFPVATSQESQADAMTGSHPSPEDCPSGTQESGANPEYCFYADDPSPAYFEFYNSVLSGTWYVSKCNADGYIYNKDGDQCLVKDNVIIMDNCPSGTKLGTTTVDYKDDKDICVKYDAFFTYSVDGASHYVGKYGKCADAELSADKCVDPSQSVPTDPTVQAGMSGADVLQNVANWFSYYHTRMLMAKSGLMNSFADINETFRIGYGSLHGNNHGLLGAAAVKHVKKFDDGSTGTQKAKFWNWLVKEFPKSATPLRKALQSVGQYYTTAQPWQTSSADSTELACRQSYTILTTDGFWNKDSPGVGDVDSSDGSQITGPNNPPYTYTAAPPYSDNRSNTLADVAMQYWMTDLRTTVGNEVPANTEDPAFWQHMATFTIGLGFVPENIEPDTASADKIFDWARGGDAITDFAWPEPASDSINNIADMLHAAVNGHGGFYSATSPQAFTKGLQDALKRIAAGPGSGASLSANSAELTSDTYVYKTMYQAGVWSGSLYAYKLDEGSGDPASQPTWSAKAQMPEPAERNIHTYNPDKSGSEADVAFEFDNLSDTEKTALGGAPDAQKKMLQYLRGKFIDEDGWRARLTLGDIVDSQPIYVAAPDPDLYSDSNMHFEGSGDYKTFADNEKNVPPVLYVAANDGMLHGFDAETGKEKYAYLPAAVILHGSEMGDHHISQIADPDYGYQNGGVPHQYFNDGQLTVADVYMDHSWKVVLVGTTGRGNAKAVYALDVTNPADVSLMWEKSAYSADCDKCSYIGQMTSKPIIAQVADGQWAVLMGNGYNSEKNRAALLQFSLSDGTLNVHTAGTNTDNGLSGPAIWIADSTDNISTVAYAGDLDGQVWSFPLVDTDGSATPDSAGTILFTAKDTDDNPQPITAAMAVEQDAATGKRWVFFGTGQYLSSTNVNDDSSQTWYGLIVNDEDGNEVAAGTRDNLAVRKIEGEIANQSRAISKASEVDPIGEKDGWYIDLSDTGERMVVANQFHGRLLYGTSIIPSATDPCDPSGSGWVMAISPFTGANAGWDVFGTTVTTGPEGEQVTRNTSGIHYDSMPNAPIFVSDKMLISTSSGEIKKQDLKRPADGDKKSERVSWREVISD